MRTRSAANNMRQGFASFRWDLKRAWSGRASVGLAAATAKEHNAHPVASLTHHPKDHANFGPRTPEMADAMKIEEILAGSTVLPVLHLSLIHI